VVGTSDLPGDIVFHGFLWTKEKGIQDLPPLPGDVYSTAVNISEKGEVVGASIDANFNGHAVVRRNRVPVDLNKLVGANPAGLYLYLAEGINSRGEIVGFASRRVSLDDFPHAFLATPVHCEARSQAGGSAAQYESSESAPVVPSERVRTMLQHQLRFGRFGVPLTGPR
jgi:uncharacterized membrane protein